MNQSTKNGEQLKHLGQVRAVSSRADLVALARRLARKISLERRDRTVTSDDVAKALQDAGYGERSLGNAAGSVFRGKDWEFTGRFVKSIRPHCHSNLLRVWRYVGSLDRNSSPATALPAAELAGDGERVLEQPAQQKSLFENLRTVHPD